MDGVEVIEVRPRLHLLRFAVGQAYLWRDGDDECTLIDAGSAGSGPLIAGALAGLGRHPRDVRRVVLTHFHDDHAGGAGEFAGLSGAEVLAHRLDAPFVRGTAQGPQPVFEEWEVPLHAAAARRLPPPSVRPVRPTAVRELADGDVLGFGGGARVVAAPGHTDGSIALLLPEHGVLFTGDAVAAAPGSGEVIRGVFNLDGERATASLHGLAALDCEVACFGHGAPVTHDAGRVLARAAGRYGG